MPVCAKPHHQLIKAGACRCAVEGITEGLEGTRVSNLHIQMAQLATEALLDGLRQDHNGYAALHTHPLQIDPPTQECCHHFLVSFLV